VPGVLSLAYMAKAGQKLIVPTGNEKEAALILAKPGHEADLKQRTLTNLYNARPAWLAMAHEALDRTVAAGYGWDDYTPAMPDEEILRRLLALNHERAASEAAS
jgi:hypothetical protein